MVNLHEAKSNLSRLVDRAAAGEEIIIARGGKPIARLVPLQMGAEKARPRPLGLFRDAAIEIPPDFHELPDDLAAAFGVK